MANIWSQQELEASKVQTVWTSDANEIIKTSESEDWDEPDPETLEGLDDEMIVG